MLVAFEYPEIDWPEADPRRRRPSANADASADEWRVRASKMKQLHADLLDFEMHFPGAMVFASRSKAKRMAAVVYLCAAAAGSAQSTKPAVSEDRRSGRLLVVVLDQSQGAVPGAQVEINLGDWLAFSGQTDGAGRVECQCSRGAYIITAAKDGFDPVVQSFDWKAETEGHVELTLMPAASKQSVEVHDTVTPAEMIVQPSANVRAEAARELPSRPATVSDALPLIPGIARQPSGKLELSGSGEHRATMMVNSTDVTDPATGEFGLTVPIDSVESINFYQASFLAEYGRYSAGLVSVETRRGGEAWHWDLNDPLPEFAIRSWRMRGLRTATPRLNFEGPIIRGKLYLSEGFEYVVRKTPLLTLPFPWNQKTEEGFNSFSQVDWITSQRNLVTASAHVAPQRLGYVNLNYFNPQPTTPDASTHDYTGTVSDKWSIFGGIWENTASLTKFDASVWPKGPSDLVIQPQVNSGSYFAQQNRDAMRYGLSSSFALPLRKWLGTHSYKAGIYAARSKDNGQMIEHPIDVEGVSGQLIEHIGFTGGSPYRNADTEMALYGQDHWVFHPHISVDLGVRFEHQQISHSLRAAPRGALNWELFPRFGTMVRAGVGLFYDHVPLGVYSFARYPERVVTFYNAAGNVPFAPITYVDGLGEVVSRRFISSGDSPGNFSPRSTTGNIQIAQPLSRMVRLRAGFLQSVSNGLVILDSTVPDPATHTASTLLSGNGTGRYRQFDVTARVSAGAKREMFFSYVRSRATGDLNDFAEYIGSFPNAIIHPNQVATQPTDLPNRFVAWGSLPLPLRFGIAPVLEYRNGFPYSTVNDQQRYVGVPNANRFPTFLAVDARVWRDFRVTDKYSVRLAVSGFNLTNHFNPEATHWNTADPAHGIFFGERHRRFTLDFDVLF